MVRKKETENSASSIDSSEGLLAVGVSIGSGLKFAVVVFFVTLIFLSDRTETYPRDEIVWRPDRALFWAILAFFVAGGITLLSRYGSLIEKSRIASEVALCRTQAVQPIATDLRLGLRPANEQAYFEIPNVARYEIRRTRAASFAMGSIGSKLGPVRLRAGQLFFDAPEVWREMDRGTIVATSTRLVFQGKTRRQEWKWGLVGDIVFDQHGLLVWPRSGKPIGIKCGPQPKLFAFIENQLSR